MISTSEKMGYYVYEKRLSCQVVSGSHDYSFKSLKIYLSQTMDCTEGGFIKIIKTNHWFHYSDTDGFGARGVWKADIYELYDEKYYGRPRCGESTCEFFHRESQCTS
jgi:hypothetical protein